MKLPPVLAGFLFTLATVVGQGPTLALLGAPATGAAPAEDAFVRPVERTWPGTLTRSGTFRRAVPARLTGHTVPDVILLDGTQPVLMTAPGIHTHVGRLLEVANIGDVHDIAVLRGRGFEDGSHPALDALALATNNGLRIWRRKPADGVVTISEVLGSGWEGVGLLATHPADPLVIFGIDDSGVVHLAEHTASGYATVEVTFPELPHPLAIACIDWDGDQSTELAVLTRSGLTIVDRLGNRVAEEQQSANSGVLTLARGGPQLHSECLVWLTPAATGGTELRLRSSSTVVDQPLYGDFVAAAAADWTCDGNEDLLLSTAANNEITFFVNISPAQPAYVLHQGAAIRVAVAASGNRPANGCSVATADFDGDGDGDLVAAIEPDGAGNTELRMVQSRTLDSDPPVEPVFVRFDNLGHGMAEVTFSFTPGPAGSHTQLTVWAEEAGVIDPLCTFSQLRSTTDPSHFVVPVDMDHLGNGHSYVMMMRPVQVENGHVVAAGEAALALMILNQGGSPGTQVGGSTPLPSIPPPPEGEDPPIPGP